MRSLATRSTTFRLALLGVLAIALVVGGAVLGWRLAPESTTETAVGRVSFDISPSLTGEATAVIPVADWGFRADAFDGPFELRAELRSLDRSALGRAAEGELSVLSATEEQLSAGARAAVLEAFAWGAGATVVLLTIATLLLRELRPRWILGAVGAALMLVLGLGSLGLSRATFDVTAFERPTYFARGAELERILAIAEDERAASRYGSEFASILRSVSTVLAGAPGPEAPARSVYLGSDLHANALVIQPLAELIGAGPLVLAGDFGQRGGVAEARLLAPRVAALGSEVIATSGNHDTAALMDALAARGVEVLGDAGSPETAPVGGLTAAGFPDPLEWSGPGDPQDRPITFEDLADADEAAADALDELIAAFDDLERPPDLAIVHQEGLATGLASALYERGYDRDLTILTGHTHRQRIERFGPITVVNGGSIGAGGVFDAGREPIGLAQLHFEPTRPPLRSVDLIAVEPFSGEARASRVVIDSLCPGEERCSFEPGAIEAAPEPLG